MSHGYKGMDLAWTFTQLQVAQSVASRILIQRSWVRTYPGCDKKWKRFSILRRYVENIPEGLLETLEKVSEMKKMKSHIDILTIKRKLSIIFCCINNLHFLDLIKKLT